MGKLRGIIPIEGTVGNITFAKTRDGIIVREKGGVSASRIESDPAFQRTRENMAEFGRAGRAAKLFRNVFRSTIAGGTDSRVVSRLMREMMRILKQDMTHPRGERTVSGGDLNLIQGFEFNSNGKLASSLLLPLTSSIDRITGVMTINLPVFVPQNVVIAPEGTTHFRLSAAGAAVDFDLNLFDLELQATNYLGWDATPTVAGTLNLSLPAASTLPLFLVLGVEYYQEVNAQNYPLKNGAFNALAVLKVDA